MVFFKGRGVNEVPNGFVGGVGVTAASKTCDEGEGLRVGGGGGVGSSLAKLLIAVGGVIVVGEALSPLVSLGKQS